MVSLAGKTLGKYRLIEQLGRGGFASVYKAYQPRLDRYIAIKVLHPHLVEGEDFLARFEREAKAVAGLRHPNIVIVHDFEVQENTYYMVMEYIDGQSLKQRLEDLNTHGEFLSLREVNRIMADITSALGYAHQQGMLHRDIKPSNVILDQAGQAFLTDFGIARILSGTQFTATGALIGTPAYMSPEQGQGLKVTAASDVYSLGIMLYEFLTGHVPYDADTPLAIIFKHIRDPLPSVHSTRPDLPADVERVVYKALAKDPEDRYQSPADLMQALQTALEKDLRAETVLSAPRSPSIPVEMAPLETSQDREKPQVQPAGAVLPDRDDQEATRVSEPPSDLPATVVEQSIAPEPVSELRPLEQTVAVEAEVTGGEGVVPVRVDDGLHAQAVTLAEDAKIRETPSDREQAVGQADHASLAQLRSTNRKQLARKRWIVVGVSLVGVIGLAFLLFYLLRPGTHEIPTQAALVATRTQSITRTATPTAPPPPIEDPGLAEFEQGMALMQESQNYRAAWEHFNLAEELGNASAELFANRAKACYEIRVNEAGCSYEDAIRDYSRAIELDPNQAWYYGGRSWSHANLRQWPEALEDVGRAIELDPQNPDYWISRGEIYMQIENWDAVLAVFTHVVETWPQYARAYEVRGTAFSTLGDWGAALRDFNTAIELAPGNFEYWLSRGRLHARMEHLDEAITDFSQVLAIDPANAPAYAERAHVLAAQGMIEAAIRDLDRAIDLDPQNDYFFIQKAHIFWWQFGDPEAALESLDQAVALNPRSWEAYTNRGEIYAYDLGNPDLALENFNLGISTAPPNMDAPFFARGMFFISAENWPAAIEDLSMVIHIHPDGPDAYGHRGDAFRQDGDLDAARVDYHRFLELTQDNPEYAPWRAEIETWLAQNP